MPKKKDSLHTVTVRQAMDSQCECTLFCWCHGPEIKHQEQTATVHSLLLVLKCLCVVCPLLLVLKCLCVVCPLLKCLCVVCPLLKCLCVVYSLLLVLKCLFSAKVFVLKCLFSAVCVVLFLASYPGHVAWVRGYVIPCSLN